MISEYRNFGTGKIDLLTCRFDPEDSMIATGELFKSSFI